MNRTSNFVVKQMKRAFPDITGVEVRDKDMIFLGDVAEGGTIDNLPACDYYGFDCDPQERIWIMGVHKDLREFMEDHGWFVECHDPGTYFAYRA